MNSRDNMLRSARFEVPERIPLFFGFNGACWTSYSQDALEELILQHPLIFPNYTKKTGKFIPAFAPWRRAGIPYTDSWGCVWETTEDGITGAVIKHAIPVWESFSKYVPPSPAEHDGWGPINWADVHKAIVDARTKGELAAGSLRHGHTFLTLTYLRGYENFMFDMCDENPQLPALIAMVEEFNRGLVEGFLQAGVEWIAYPEDLGMQVGPMLARLSLLGRDAGGK